MGSARRHHRKSRNGCLACKSRRVKCDEAEPCSNCVRWKVPCSLVTNGCSSSASPSTVEASLSSLDLSTFTLVDFSLFHHFTTTIAECLGNDGFFNSWRSVIPGVAPKYPYLLHEILAVSAVHLHHHTLPPLSGDLTQSSAPQPNYLRIAQEHQRHALQLLSNALTGPNAPQEANALFACSVLNVNYYMAMCADDARALIFSDDPPGPPAWIMPIRGAKMISFSFDKTFAGGPMGVLVQDYADATPVAETLDFPDTEADRELRNLQDQLEWRLNAEDRITCDEAITELRISFAAREEGTAMAIKSAALRWPSTMPDELLEVACTRREPWGLVIFAYWLVIVNEMETKWWLSGKCGAQGMFAVIDSLVSGSIADLLAWPRHNIAKHRY